MREKCGNSLVEVCIVEMKHCISAIQGFNNSFCANGAVLIFISCVKLLGRPLFKTSGDDSLFDKTLSPTEI